MKKSIIIIILILFNLTSIFANNVEIIISEESKITKLLNGNYAIDALGSIEIKNPSNTSTIYEINIPLALDSLIGINKIVIDNSSNKFDFSFNKIKTYMLLPNETIKTGFRIYGLVSYDIYNKTKIENISILKNYFSDIQISTNHIVNLQKVQREGFKYESSNDWSTLPTNISESPSSNSSRLVPAGIRNPTNFNLFGKEINLYKTHVGDPFFANGVLIDSKKNISILKNSFYELNFFDNNSDETSVYWLSSKVFVEYNISSNHSSSYIIQSPPSSGGGGSGGSGGGGGGSIINPPKNDSKDDILSSIKDFVFIKKNVDKTIVRKGEEFKVTLSIVNINNFEIKNLELFDEVPQGYEIKDVSNGVKIENQVKLKFLIDSVLAYETFSIEYTLINKQEKYKGITYLKPAILILNTSEELYSEGVIIINDLLPEQKIFIQKETKYLDNDFVEIKIKIKNLGSVELNDILVSDNLDKNALIKAISKVFHDEGIWKISSLKPGEEWEVSYITEKFASNINTLPNLYGVDSSNVYGTLVFSEEIITYYGEESRWVEKIGLGIAVVLLLFYVLF